MARIAVLATCAFPTTNVRMPRPFNPSNRLCVVQLLYTSPWYGHSIFGRRLRMRIELRSRPGQSVLWEQRVFGNLSRGRVRRRKQLRRRHQRRLLYVCPIRQPSEGFLVLIVLPFIWILFNILGTVHKICRRDKRGEGVEKSDNGP